MNINAEYEQWNSEMEELIERNKQLEQALHQARELVGYLSSAQALECCKRIDQLLPRKD